MTFVIGESPTSSGFVLVPQRAAFRTFVRRRLHLLSDVRRGYPAEAISPHPLLPKLRDARSDGTLAGGLLRQGLWDRAESLEGTVAAYWQVTGLKEIMVARRRTDRRAGTFTVEFIVKFPSRLVTVIRVQ